MPFFTVIVPTCNRAELLREAVLSVLDQTFENFELLVVDDHSRDNTEQVISSFNDIRIRYILNDRGKGGAGTRNTGIFMAKGEWIAFLDDDDIWLPRKLELQNKKIQEVDDSVGLIYTGHATYDFNKKQEISLFMPKKEGWIQNDLLYTNYIGTYSSVAIRSELLKKLGGLDERFPAYQDNELYVRLSGLSKIAFVNEKLLYVRDSNTDRISDNSEKKLKGYQLFWEKNRDLINQDSRLKHRMSSRIFVHAAMLGNIREMFKVFPWTLAGFFVDFSNVIWTFRIIPLLFYERIIKRRFTVSLSI